MTNCGSYKANARSVAVGMLAAFLLLNYVPRVQAVPNLRSKLKTVGTDPIGDWGQDHVPLPGEVGSAHGADLVKASIGMVDRATLRFVIETTDLSMVPPSGSMPVGYAWDFEVKGHKEAFEIESCEPDFPACVEAMQEAGEGEIPFIMLSFCRGTDGDGNGCSVTYPVTRAMLWAQVDTSKGTLTVDVPLIHLQATDDSSLPGPRSKIIGSDIFGAPVRTFSVIPVAGPSDSPYQVIPNDDLEVSKTFRIPGRRKGRT